MNANQFKPIILLTLQQSTGQFRSLDDLADHLVTRMSQFQEMVELAGLVFSDSLSSPAKSGLILTPDAPLPPQPAVTPTPVHAVKLRDVDISERITEDGVKDNFGAQELYDWYSKHLPPTIEIQPPGFDKPLTIYRQALRRSPEGMGNFVRILYGFQGAGEAQCAAFVVAGTDTEMNAERVIEEIVRGATGMYQAQPPAPVQPRRPPAPNSLWETLPGAMSDETDPETGAGDRNEWNRALAQPPLNFRE